ATHLHRSIEPVVTGRALATIFRSEKHFVHHAPLPATPQMGDEGAANHTRLCADHDGHGLELFVYGEAGEKDAKPAVHPARQNRAAGEAI
ncbi:N-succinylarginine dihydrolase, partial [Escherichia coli]|uniref:N-succinylarginine dihydrolase n=1 Tax=Escherichia coli TaxID=562 RepID=UPI0021196DD8